MLSGLADQDYPSSDAETIIVDGGSTDGTREIAQEFSVKLVEERKPGPGAARNQGLRHARGEIIAHLDTDTIPTRRWLSELVKPFNDPKVYLVGGRIIDYRPVTPAERFVAAHGLHDPKNTIFREIFPFVPSINMAVRHEAATAVRWSEELITGEDADFCYRLLKRYSTQIAYAPEAILFHRNRTTDEGLRVQAWTYGEGVAHIYSIYPDEVNWNMLKTLQLAWAILVNATAPPLTRAAETCKLTTHERFEYSCYNRFWTFWFWRGFFSYRKHRNYRSPPPPNFIFKARVT
jgi:glycosyltransferase involved in cell wall biosynthesis